MHSPRRKCGTNRSRCCDATLGERASQQADIAYFPYFNVEAVKFVSRVRFARAQNRLVRDLEAAPERAGGTAISSALSSRPGFSR
jgi:hypothetical protein